MARDWFADAFGAAVDDIRKRLIEEPWFGREVTPPHTREPGMAEQLGWERKGAAPQSSAQDHNPAHDADRDR